MQSHSKKIESSSILISIVFVGILTSLFQIFRGDTVLVDPFHHGEFFAATVGLLPDVKYLFHPLTIHGALDFIPALFAERQWGGDNYFLPTFAIYKLLDFVAAISFILIAFDLTRCKAHQWLLLLAVAVVAPLLVGYRDLILLVSIYFLLKINDPGLKGWLFFFLQVSFGVLVAFGVFWSYDRGIAGALSLGVAVLILLFRNGWHVISLASFFVTVGGLSLTFKVFSIENYLNDVFVLMRTSGEWSYGWQKWPVILTSFSVFLNFIAISLIVRKGLKSKSITQDLPVVVSLVFLSIFMVKVGINRADLPHIYFSCWIPVLIFLFVFEKEVPIKKVGVFVGAIFLVALALTFFLKSYGFVVIAGILVFSVLEFESGFLNKFRVVGFGLLIAACLSFVIYVEVKSFFNGQYAWIRALSSPASNRLSATVGVVWASDRLKERAVDCVFDLSNNGVINGLVRRPSCSRFTYPVYAGSQYESTLISDLRVAAPRAIVYSSTYWSYSIDGRDMKKRFPVLNEFILKNYPKEECDHGYCVRYLGI